MARRVFFALWPTPELADEIAPRAARLGRGGRLVAPARLHLTLAFHGAVDDRAIDALIANAAGLSGAAFTLVIDRVSGFPQARTTWFGPSQAPTRLYDLATNLMSPSFGSKTRSGLDTGIDGGVDPKAFVPHITVIRDGLPGADEALFPPLIWHVDQFCLVESGADACPGDYRVLERWPLAGRSHPL